MSVIRTEPVPSLDSPSSVAAFAEQQARGESVRLRRARLWQPGVVIELDAPLAMPADLCVATVAAASTLFDQETRMWLSPSLDCGVVRKYLRAHTGSIHVAEPTLADFAIVARPRELPPLVSFHCGTQVDPWRSSKIIVQVESLADRGPLRLAGPGILGAKTISAKGLGEAFLSQWANNADLFPRGVDVFLTCGQRMCFIPRTTRIEI